MRILKTLVSFTCDDAALPVQVDTIEHEGAFWLVPGWVPSPDGKSRMPIRIIRLDKLDYRSVTGNAFGDFVRIPLLPKAVYEGRQSGGPYKIEERPDIKA